MNAEELSGILSQPFTYLTEGLQAFIYVSKDGKYVLKTFKDLEQSKDQFKAWGLNPDDITSGLVENSTKSYALAFERLKDETAIMYVHVSNHALPGQKIILDEKEYDASELQFIVQEKVELVKDRIKRLMSRGDMEEVHKIIEDIMNFIAGMWQQGITEDTFNWDHNYGYTAADKLVQIDVGTFWEGDEYLKEEIRGRKLLDNESSKWLAENYPELVEFYKEKVGELYAKFSSQ
jgi:hypothetical protein